MTLEINPGNSETVAVEDYNASKTFWSEYFTNSQFYNEEDDFYLIENEVDLMGNPIKNKLLQF